jgi:excisionase family DNA binding protein
VKKYITPSEAAKHFGVCLHTLRRWEKNGQIEAIRTPSGRERRYCLESYTGAGHSQPKQVILYARVSSHQQKDDLNRQIARLVELYPGAELISEVGGGLNWKRKKFRTLLERVMSGAIGTIVVCTEDRLARFGFDHIQWLCEQYGCQIVVLNETIFSPERELVEDVLSIIHDFSSRLYGLRKYKTLLKEDQNLSTTGVRKDMETVDSSR